MDTPDDRTIEMPYAPDAELAILACMIENPKTLGLAAIDEGITPDFFYQQAHQELYSILIRRIREQKSLDPSSIKEDIRAEKPDLLKISKLAEVLNHEYDPASWGGYLSALRQTHAKRTLITAAIQSGDMTGPDAVSIVRKATESALSALNGSKEVYTAKKASAAFLDALAERYEDKNTSGQLTGISPIDSHTGGMRKGELWVIGAKTSGGKSVLMLQMAGKAILDGKRVAIFSLELGVEEVMGRIISHQASVPMSQIMNPSTLDKGAMMRIRTKVGFIAESNLAICDMHGLSMDQIAGHCIRMKQQDGIDLVIIDYLQMITPTRMKGQSREQEVASISRQCKQLAKQLKCPVITATQLNEAGQSRESRAIEHDADNVLMIGDAEEAGKSFIEFWKCRNGERGKEFTATLNGLYQRFDY